MCQEDNVSEEETRGEGMLARHLFWTVLEVILSHCLVFIMSICNYAETPEAAWTFQVYPNSQSYESCSSSLRWISVAHCVLSSSQKT